MEFFALPAVEGDAPFDMERNSRAVLDHYLDTVKERILQDGELAPVAVVRSENKEHIIHCGPMMKDEDTKEKLAHTLRKIALETDAIAFIFIAEAWTAAYNKDDPTINKIMPSQRADRVECVLVSAQYKGDKSVLRIAEIVRDADRKITHLLEKDFPEKEDDMKFEGRFAGILDDESDDDRWSRLMENL